jgi:hypothetical protein
MALGDTFLDSPAIRLSRENAELTLCLPNVANSVSRLNSFSWDWLLMTSFCSFCEGAKLLIGQSHSSASSM